MWNRRARRERRAAAAAADFADAVELLVRRQYRLIGVANLAARFGADRLLISCRQDGSGVLVLIDRGGVLVNLADHDLRLAQYARRCARDLVSPGEVLAVDPLITVR